MAFIQQHLNTLIWLFGLFCLISNTAAQSQTKRSSRITSSRTSFGTNVKSSTNPSSNGVNFDCPEEFGYYPHPTDCTQYYVCVFGGALLESCTGGLMYSHELQTCDWPRNVGCEVVDSGDRDQLPQQQQTNANQHVPSRVRFGAAFTSPQQQQTQAPQQILKPTIPPQYHRQPPQVIQAQVQTIPPPPELKVPPNPVITSRGQPKHLLEAQEEIAKLYADAQETLPPVEEEESDRQQRVYRGQPSTVSQVQKDRDGIIHQASINAIPNNDKFSSYAFGTQYRDIEYQQQQQQQQQQHRQQPQQHQYQQPIRSSQAQQSTYRPLDIFTTPQPQTAQRETYKPQQQQQKPQERPTYQSNQQPQERPTYQSNQQPLVYNTDYDEDLIAQIEQDNAYDQPTRPPSRKEQVSIQTLNSGPSSTVRTLIAANDERNYYSTLTTPIPPTRNNVNTAEEPTYIYETEYVDEPDYYYQDKLQRPVAQPVATTYKPKIKTPINNQNDDYDNIIGIKLQNSQDVNRNKPKNRINTRPETVTQSSTSRTTRPSTTYRTTTPATTPSTTTTTTTTTPKPSTTKLSKTTSPSTTTTKSRSKQTHAKKLQQQQEQLLQQDPSQSKSQQTHKHFRQEPSTTTTSTQSHTSTTTLKTTTSTTTTHLPTTHKPKYHPPPPKIPLAVVKEPENPTIRVVAQTQSHSRQVQNYQPSRPEKDPNPQSLEDVETVYDESQNVQVQSAEPPKSRGTGTQYISASNDRGVYVNENSPVRGNSPRFANDKSLTEFKSKSYDIYGGLKSNDFVDDQKSKNSKDLSAKKLIKSYVISDVQPQSFKPPPTEKNVAKQQDSLEDIEVLNGASSSTTTLRYPGTFKTSTEAKPFEYSLQTGKTGFTLRAQHLGLAEEPSQPLYERRPAIQYFTTPSSTTTPKTTTPFTTTTTTEAPITTTTSTSSTTTTEMPSFRPHTEIVYVESYYEDDLQPTTYAPPLRTWRNGRPTIQTTSTTLSPRSQPIYDYSYRLPTESSKLQSVAKEYLPRSTTTSSTTTTTSTTTTPRTTTTTVTTPRTTSTTTSTTTPRTTSSTTSTTPRTTSSTTSTTTLANTEKPVQTFTARASVFKDNLQKTTIASNQRFVSPYKSLETLLQKEERSSFSSARSTVKPKNLALTSTAHPFLQTTNKPLRSYFLITSPPKNLNETLFATMASNNRNFSVSDALISSVKTNHKAAFSTTTTTSTTESTTLSIPTTTPTTMSTIINTSPLRVNLYPRNEASEKPRPRGTSRYTAATATNLLDNDEPTTYTPKQRFKPFEQDITTTSSSPLQGRRKIQRARIAALQNQRNNPVQAPKTREKYQSFKQELKKHYKTEAIDQSPKAEALIAGPVENQQDNTIESTKSTETTEQEQVVAITDRPLKYYYSQKYRQQTGERSLAESLQNAGYITSSSKSGNKIFKPTSVLEQLQQFLAGSDSDENESSSPQFVQDFSEPEIKAAVQEIKNLYASTGQRPSWTTTTTTTLRPTTTAKPPTTAYTTSPPSTTHNNLNSIQYTSTYSTLAPHSSIKSTQAQISYTSPSTTTSTTPTITTTTTTPKYFPKFPSSTYSFLTSSSSSSTTTSTTTTTTTTPAYASYSSQAFNKASSGGGLAAPSSSSTSLGNLPPARVSRVNNALKSSIAAAATASSSSSSLSGNGNNAGHSSSSTSNAAAAGRSNKFSLGSTVKCSDTTSNAKCNEIPTRINSNSNRNRGSASSSYQGDRDIAAPVTSNRGTHPPRTRPTLKPSGTIVSKAQEFVDIYRNPPSRPDPLYPTPQPDKTAAKCRKDVCLLPDCSCGGRDIPGDMPVEQVPQIVLITFDDSVNDLNKQLYIDLFEKGRVNPNGCPITATFYVSHEWTDYSQVQNLYSDGHEMASHTISHSFGEQFSQKKWTREIAGQREILAAYGGVKLSDVRGMRAPFLSVGGNKMYKMLYDSNFTYDSSMPVYENRPPSWPYTLDYKIFHDCMIPPCPTKSYPGVWQVPMVMWQDLNGGRCSMGDACSNPSEAENVSKMIMKNFERHYTTNRAPFGLFYHAAWFTQPHHKEGFIKFLDTINAMPDVWIVTNWQALQWVRDPTPISRINSFQPFQCDYSDRPKRCNNPKVCNLWHKSGVRYMKTCQPCPDIYPWTGKTGIRSSRIDNDIEDSTA